MIDRGIPLSRGRQTDKFKVEEAEVEAAVPVLRKYIAEIRVTRPYFNANPDSSDEAIAAELVRHSVLGLIPVS